MVAYLVREKNKCFALRVCETPCNGLAYQNALTVYFRTKREARAYCASHAIRPWNF